MAFISIGTCTFVYILIKIYTYYTYIYIILHTVYKLNMHSSRLRILLYKKNHIEVLVSIHGFARHWAARLEWNRKCQNTTLMDNISNVQDQIWGISCKSKFKNLEYMSPKSENNILASIPCKPIQPIQLLRGLLSFNLSQPFTTLGPRALARARCAHVPHLSAPARLLGSGVIGVVLKVQHVQHLGW